MSHSTKLLYIYVYLLSSLLYSFYPEDKQDKGAFDPSLPSKYLWTDGRQFNYTFHKYPFEYDPESKDYNRRQLVLTFLYWLLWPLYWAVFSDFFHTHLVLSSSTTFFASYSMEVMNSGSNETGAISNGSEADVKVRVFSSSSELLEKLHEKWSLVKKKPYPAMYSSIFGGIITDPAMMVIPIDDHMVHRGHGVFDTAVLLNGHLYELDAHLDRFLRSASKAKIPPPFPRSILRSILIQLTAASQLKKGTLRYWLSAGPGNFLLTPAGNAESSFYAVAIDEDFSQCREGVKVITSTIPMKTPEFATMKNVNYLPNVLAKMEAEERGAFASIWVDEEGYIAEGPNVNVAFITSEKELILPSFDKILSGCTALRLLNLAPKLVEKGKLKSVKTANITVREAKTAAEMMFVGSTLPLLPIITWDEESIGDGRVGELTMALSDLMWDDMASGPETERTPVPYI